MLKTALVALAAFPLAAAAAPADLPGWQAARWGMTAPELRRAFGRQLQPLPGRWHYDGAYAEWMLPDVRIAGASFTAYFQMASQDDRLRQVLLQGRRANPAGYDTLASSLAAEYGPPQYRCVSPLNRRNPMRVEEIWRFPTTTVHATFLDFRTDSVVREDPNAERNPLVPDYQRRRNRDLPRRVLLRFHATTATALMPPLGDCVRLSAAQP